MQGLTVAKQAIQIFNHVEQTWVEDGLWSVWEYPDHPGAVAIQVCVGDPLTEAAGHTRERAARLLVAAGWRIEDAVADGVPYLVAFPPPLHNYCPHPLTLRVQQPPIDVTLLSEGNARVSQEAGELQQEIWLVNDHCLFPIYGPSTYGSITGLPDPQAGQYYIVSMMVAQALPDRADLLVPGTGPADEAIRDNGQIVAVTRLIAPNA